MTVQDIKNLANDFGVGIAISDRTPGILRIAILTDSLEMYQHLSGSLEGRVPAGIEVVFTRFGSDCVDIRGFLND